MFCQEISDHHGTLCAPARENTFEADLVWVQQMCTMVSKDGNEELPRMPSINMIFGDISN